MCLILFAYEVHPLYRLIAAANRDEFYTRPAQPASFWPDAPGLLAGRDLTEGGTWLGITRGGRFSAVTNYRDPRALVSQARSRGHLVADYLRGSESPGRYLARVAERGGDYNGFNLLAGDASTLHYYSNRGDEGPRALAPGIYGLSNHLLDTAWPKVEAGKRGLAEMVASGREIEAEELFHLLSSRERADDARLPETGVGIEMERMLSPLFIESEGYGTRCSTVTLVRRDGLIELIERTHAPIRNEARYEFETESADTTASVPVE